MLAAFGMSLLDNQRDLTIVIIETNSDQSLMRGALRELKDAEITVVDALFGEGVMKLHQQGLVLRPDGAQRQRAAVAHFNLSDVLGRVWAHGGTWQCGGINRLIVNDYSGIKRDQPLSRC